MINLTDTYPHERAAAQTAVALGFFDGLHEGHMAVLRETLSIDGLQPACFTFPDMPAKQAKLIMTAESKLKALGDMGIKYIFAPEYRRVSSLTPEKFVREVLCGILSCRVAVCGEDFRFGKNAAGDTALLRSLGESCGFEVRVVESVYSEGDKISSGRIRMLLADGQPEKAARLMGRPFGFTLPVCTGRRLAGTLGFPTINQQLPDELLLPRFGVYASSATVRGREYYGVTNIGVRPTVADIPLPVSETHIFDCGGDLYGEEITIKLRRFMRGEVKFDSVDALKKQIESDCELARSMFF